MGQAVPQKTARTFPFSLLKCQHFAFCSLSLPSSTANSSADFLSIPHHFIRPSHIWVHSSCSHRSESWIWLALLPADNEFGWDLSDKESPEGTWCLWNKTEKWAKLARRGHNQGSWGCTDSGFSFCRLGSHSCRVSKVSVGEAVKLQACHPCGEPSALPTHSNEICLVDANHHSSNTHWSLSETFLSENYCVYFYSKL